MREALLRLAIGHVSRVAGPKNSASPPRRRPDLAGDPTRIPNLLIQHQELNIAGGLLMREPVPILGSSDEF